MRRTQHDRSEASRAALIAAARELFASGGYAAVGTEAIVQAAGLTRGAMYHQFGDKTELFAAVFETVERELTERLAAALAGGAGEGSTVDLLFVGIEAWLDACADPEVQRILLIDGPSVLGWDRWREVQMHYGAGLVEAAVAGAMADGTIEPMPLRPLTHVLLAALEEAALYLVAAERPEAARADLRVVMHRLVGGLLAPTPPESPGSHG